MEHKNEKTINSPHLQDGDWEIDHVLTNWEQELRHNLPEKLKQLIRSEIALLQNTKETHDIKPLSVYALTAKNLICKCQYPKYHIEI